MQIALGSDFLVLSLRESNLRNKTTIPTSFYHTHRTHGTGIFSYIYHKENQPNVAKYTSPVDPMGYNMVTMMKLSKSQQPSLVNFHRRRWVRYGHKLQGVGRGQRIGRVKSGGKVGEKRGKLPKFAGNVLEDFHLIR